MVSKKSRKKENLDEEFDVDEMLEEEADEERIDSDEVIDDEKDVDAQEAPSEKESSQSKESLPIPPGDGSESRQPERIRLIDQGQGFVTEGETVEPVPSELPGKS